MPARAMEVAQGVVTGSSPAVNKLRELSEQEIETWGSSNRMQCFRTLVELEEQLD
jgi:hypothetical protein